MLKKYNKILESKFPYIISIIMVWTAILINVNIFKINNFKDILNTIINLSAIMISFLVAMISIFSISIHTEIIKRIIKVGAIRLLFNYISSSVYYAFLTVLMSILFFAFIDNSEGIYWYYFLFWIFVVSMFLCCAFRILYFSIEIMKQIMLPLDDTSNVIRTDDAKLNINNNDDIEK